MNIWRYLALGLLAINLILFGLRYLAPPESAAREQTAPELPDAPRIALVAEMLASDEHPGEQCFTIGPFSSPSQLQAAEDRMRPFTGELRTRESEADQDRGWWVYLPTANRQEALGLTRVLDERGVKDYYVVPDGGPENALSLGLYESHSNARSRQARIRQLGFEPQVTVYREQVPQYWLDYRIATDQRSPWRFILRTTPGTRQLQIPCF